MKKLTKQEQIAESIKRFRERFYPKLSKMVDDVRGADAEIDIKHLEDFLKQELQAVVEKTREETAKEIFGTMDEWPLCRNIADNIERYTDFRDAFLSDKEKT